MAKKTKKNQEKKYYITIGVLAALIIAIAAVIIWQGTGSPTGVDDSLSNTNTSQDSTGTDSGESVTVTDTNFLDLIDKTDAEKVKFTMTDGQSFTMELYPRVAPITVANFLKLVDEKFYDGLTFHRIIEGFMAQGGAYDPVDQSNDPADSIKGEFLSNGVENKLSHRRGVVSMARTSVPDSASSQFFICYGDASYLDGNYAAFGYVTEGMETVDSFLSEGTNANDEPLKEVRIKSAERIK